MVEMFWLNALKRDTDLKIMEPVARRDGGYVTVVGVPGLSGERRCALFRWVPGRCLADCVTSERYYKLGQVIS